MRGLLTAAGIVWVLVCFGIAGKLASDADGDATAIVTFIGGFLLLALPGVWLVNSALERLDRR